MTICFCHFWWLVRATYVVDGRFFRSLFWKAEGQLPYTVINVQDGGEGGGTPNIGKLRKFGKLQIFIKVAGSIGSHIESIYGSHLELFKMATNQNAKFHVLGIFQGIFLIVLRGKTWEH